MVEPCLFDGARGGVGRKRRLPTAIREVPGIRKPQLILLKAELREALIGSGLFHQFVDPDEQISLLPIVLAAKNLRKWWTKVGLVGNLWAHRRRFWLC